MEVVLQKREENVVSTFVEEFKKAEARIASLHADVEHLKKGCVCRCRKSRAGVPFSAHVSHPSTRHVVQVPPPRHEPGLCGA